MTISHFTPHLACKGRGKWSPMPACQKAKSCLTPSALHEVTQIQISSA